MADAEAEVVRGKRISAIWLVPIVALLLGVWMVVYTLQSQGPLVTIVFSDAEGIEEGKTKIKLRSVEIGTVESAELGEDLRSVVVTARLDNVARPLLKEDTQFWVVRPRVGARGVSGIGTLLSGGYIQLSPGKGAEGRREFVGLDEPPVTPAGTPGLRLRLVSDEAGSVSVGNPILYKGFVVGRVESEQFEIEDQRMHYEMFIAEPYSDLVNSNSRFWDASGIKLNASADGVELSMASIETLLTGGIAFGLPEGVDAGGPVVDGRRFRLYPSYTSVNERPYRVSLEYVVRFPQSVRGLRPGAPVEYRGIPVGRVDHVLLEEAVEYDFDGHGAPIPILIRFEPARLGLPDDQEGAERLKESVRTGVEAGMRATLATGNLLTGSLYVALDFYDDVEFEALGDYLGRPTIPTISAGLEGIQVKISDLLDKLADLPLERTLARVDALLESTEALLANESLQQIPESLDATLSELRGVLDSFSGESALQERVHRTMGQLDRTLQSLRSLLATLDEQPNALIFNREPGPDPEPPAGTP